MFTWCKKTDNSCDDTAPYRYMMRTEYDYFDPTLCRGIAQPFISGRGIPSNQIDIDTLLRGQNRRAQPYCNTTLPNSRENESIHDVSTTYYPPVPNPNSPAPCYDIDGFLKTKYHLKQDIGGCTHEPGACGNECGCPPSCICKARWAGYNRVRPLCNRPC